MRERSTDGVNDGEGEREGEGRERDGGGERETDRASERVSVRASERASERASGARETEAATETSTEMPKRATHNQAYPSRDNIKSHLLVTKDIHLEACVRKESRDGASDGEWGMGKQEGEGRRERGRARERYGGAATLSVPPFPLPFPAPPRPSRILAQQRHDAVCHGEILAASHTELLLILYFYFGVKISPAYF